MSMTPRLKDCDKLLIVEGYTDLLFFAELLEHLNNNQGVYIKHFNGASDLIQQLGIFLTPDVLKPLKSVCVLVDSDANPPQRASQISKAIEDATGISTTCGAWAPGPPAVGFFLLPGCGSVGEMETLVWDAWSHDAQNVPRAHVVERYLADMRALGLDAQSIDKARVGSVLAVVNDEDPRLGPGFRARGNISSLSFDLPQYATLRTFLAGV